MQKIFYNANVHTLSESKKAEAFLINNGSIVFVGTNKEVLAMKTKDTKIVDMKNQTILPAFFAMFTQVFQVIENSLIQKNIIDKNQISVIDNDKEDGDYDKFENFEAYLNEFLILQENLLKLGITTLTEINLNKRSFVFFKKLSESEKLKIDVVGYIDIKNAKFVMDDNCKSFRKYTNHFRLGGYYIELDGDLTKKTAWLKKPYIHGHGYIGYGNYFDEQLKFIIKSAIDEKKQLLVHASGDMSVTQFVRCYSEAVNSDEVEDNYRPVIIGCNLIGNKEIEYLKQLKIALSFNLDEIRENDKKHWKIIGLRKYNLKPVKLAYEKGIDVIFQSGNSMKINPIKIIQTALQRKTKDELVLGKKHKLTFSNALEILILNSSIYCFDDSYKGSIESGKQGNFVVLNHSIDDDLNINFDELSVLETYICGEKVK